MEGGPTIEPLDVFNVALSADAGADSSDDSSSALNILIQDMSGPELDKLDTLIQKVQHRILDTEEEQKRHIRTCQKLGETIAKRRADALKEEWNLKQKIKKKAGKLRLSHIVRSPKGGVQSLCVGENQLSVEAFINRFLQDELSIAESLLAEGLLLARRKRQRPRSFLRDLLSEILPHHLK